MQELKRKLLTRQISYSEALPLALPDLRGKIADDKLLWLASELQGYQNAMEFYQSRVGDFPKWRIVKGQLRLLNTAGALVSVNHPFANRAEFFLGAPISWLEQFASQPEDPSLVDLPELTSLIGKGTGNVVCVLPRAQLNLVIANSRRDFMSLLDHVLSQTPQA